MGVFAGESKRDHRGAPAKYQPGMLKQSMGRFLGEAGGDVREWRLWTRYLSGQFNRKAGRIHLCNSKPCGTTEEYAMHVTRLRIFSVEAFDRPYMNAYMKRQLGKWQGEDLDDIGDDAIDVSKGKEGEEDVRKDLEKEAEKPEPLSKPPPAPAPAVAAGGDGDNQKRKGLKIGEEEKLKLRQRLDEARARMLKGTVGRGAGQEADAGYPHQEGRTASSKPDYTPSLAHTADLEQLGRPALEDAGLEETLQKMEEADRRKDQRRVKDKRRSPSRRDEKRKDKKKKKEDSNDTITRSLQGQLALMAAEAARQTAEKAQEAKKKKKARSSHHQLAKILTKLTGQKDPPDESSQEGDKKQKKDKKRRKEQDGKKSRRRKKGQDPEGSPSSSGSPMKSSRSNSGEDSEEDSSTSEDKKLDAPLKRRSKEKPGSVLQMLINHARSQLDQSSKVTIGKQEAVMSGVKMGSYFSIVVRPQLGSAMAQAWEMHVLSQSIDLLRQGSLDLLGDVLAGRFMSLHQSVIDGSWSTARHLELLPLEEGTAATPEVLLRVRKHAKLASKLAPGDSWHWQSGGKGRGGRSKGGAWGDATTETKGKGKKGQKGKGKFKSWQGQEKKAMGKAGRKSQRNDSS